MLEPRVFIFSQLRSLRLELPLLSNPAELLDGYLPKNKSGGDNVCVCTNHLNRCKTSVEFRSGYKGMEGNFEAPSNEAPDLIPGYHQGHLVRYLQNNVNVEFLVDGNRLWKN